MAALAFVSNIVVLFALVACVSSCGFPSKLWCSNEDIAKKCGVYNQCLANDWAESSGASPVQVTLCFESMCPDCKDFTVRQLFPAFKDIGPIMNLTLVPFGNAIEKKSRSGWEFDCQFGPDECAGNIIETCALHFVPKMADYLPWFNCIEGSSSKPKKAAVECAKKFPQIPIEKVLNCSTSSMGNALEHQMALSTDTACSNNQYVPWVMIDGEHSKDAEKSFRDTVCKAYKGTQPPACRK